MRIILCLAACSLMAQDSALGQFADPAPLTSTAARAGSVLAADLDGNGRQDILAASLSERALVLFAGNGDGTFAPARTLVDLPFEAGLVRQGDMDGDLDQDLIVAGPGGDIVWIERTGPDQFAPPRVVVAAAAGLRGIIGLQIADEEGDGDLDVFAVLNTGVHAIENLGGVFAQPILRLTTISNEGRTAEIRDMDGDNDADAVVTVSNLLYLFLNSGGAMYDPPIRIGSLSVPTYSAVVADVDADGDNDIVQVTGATFSRVVVHVLRNVGPGSFQLAATMDFPGTGFAFLLVDDFGSDANVDIALVFEHSSELVVFEGQGGAAFRPGVLANGGGGTRTKSLASADFDGDGRFDLATVESLVVQGLPEISDSTIVSTLRNEWSGALPVFPSDQTVTSGVSLLVSIATADLNGDGSRDVLAISRSGPFSSWIDGNGLGGFGTPLALPFAGLRVADVVPADLDGDGIDDVAMRGTDSSLSVLRGLGDGSFESPVLVQAGAPWGSDERVILVADMDGDGDPDIVGHFGGRIEYFENLGGFSWAQGVTIPTPFVPLDGAYSLVAGDLDGNGSMDLVLGGFPSVVLDPLTATPTFYRLMSPSPIGSNVALADLDGDGHLDIVLSGAPEPNVVGPLWARNAGRGGRFATPVALAALEMGPGDISTLDVDIDGDIDLVVTDSTGALRWLANAGNGVMTLMPEVLALDVTAMAVDDMDSDGDDDLVVAHPGKGGVSWIEITALGPIGMNYCGPTTPNSTGLPGRMQAVGSVVALDDALRLRALDLPNQSFGYFLASRVAADTFPVQKSVGRLCLGGAIGRLNGPSEVQFSAETGHFQLELDLTAVPTPTGPVAVVPGDDWYFQAWFRDSTGGGVTSNFTDGVNVTYQ